MARNFDGANDSLHTSSGTLSAWTFGTFVIVCKRNQTAFSNLMTLHTSGGTSRAGMEIEDSGTGNHLQWQYDSSFVSSTFTVVNSNNWVLLAMGKDTGTTNVRCHKYVYDTNTWTHENTSGTATNSTAPGASSTMRFGEWEGADDFNGDVAIAGAWISRNLTDAEVENLAHSINSWVSLAPDALWVFDQAATTIALNDHTGNGANQSALTGTTVSTNSSPIGYGQDIVVPHSIPAGGTTFPVDQTDSAGLTDSVAQSQEKVFSDGIGLTDSTALSQEHVLPDQTGLTDNITAALTIPVTQTDNIGLTDNLLQSQEKVATDQTNLTDATTIVSTFDRTFTDQTGLTDSTVQETGKLFTQSDNTGLTDNILQAITNVHTDQIGLTDTAAAAATFPSTYTDQTGLTDATTIQSARLVEQTDNVGLTDAAAIVMSYLPAFTDLTGLSDSYTATGPATAPAPIIGYWQPPDTIVAYVQSGTITSTVGNPVIDS